MAARRRFSSRRRASRPESWASLIWRWLRRTLASLLALAVALVVAAAVLIHQSAPERDDGGHIPGLHAAVSILLDDDGIPRIRAADAHDAAMALGWLHARDRFFQMETMRRLVSGRIAELAGPAGLANDRLMRTLGLRRHAEADWATLPEPAHGLIEAYAAGVNARIAQRGSWIAPEFLALRLIGHGTPEAWTGVDSLLWGKLMALYLSTNWRTEAARLAAVGGGLTPEAARAWWPASQHTRADAALDQHFADLAGTARRLLAAIPTFPDPNTQPSEASDAWAVDGAHSATGAPLLAGDPHLAFSLPGIWYLARIDTPDATLVGATAPGVPFLVLGQNGHIAWSFTTTGADTEDLFVETVNPDGTYQTPTGPAAFTTRRETIAVRGAPDQPITIRASRHGPLVSDLEPGPRGAQGPELALASAALTGPDYAAAGLLALNRAVDIAGAAAAAPLITAPVQNLMVADRAHIALFMTGRIPVRRAGDGAYPVAGGDGAHDWVGFATGRDLPAIIDPPSGRLVNANDPVVGADFPLLIGADAYGPWRAERIREGLSAGRPDSAGFAAMQADDVSLWARQLLPRLLALDLPPGELSTLREMLRGWDGRMAVNLPQPLIFETWMQRFYIDLLPKTVPIAAAPLLEVVAAALATPPSAGATPTLCGDCAGLLRQSLGEARTMLSARFGADPTQWRWGNVHRAVFAHPFLGQLPLIGDWFTAALAAPGSDSTLFRGGNRAGDLTARHGASYRGVYDLADPERSRFMTAPGQSGDPFSPQARALLARWRDGATVTLPREPDLPAHRLTLEP